MSSYIKVSVIHEGWHEECRWYPCKEEFLRVLNKVQVRKLVLIDHTVEEVHKPTHEAMALLAETVLENGLTRTVERISGPLVDDGELRS